MAIVAGLFYLFAQIPPSQSAMRGGGEDYGLGGVVRVVPEMLLVQV